LERPGLRGSPFSDQVPARANKRTPVAKGLSERSTMAEMHCDVAIIGAGTAGLAAERAARRDGARTLLIDDRFAGTTCATVGCMPSKLLIAAANAAHNVRKASIFGIRTSEPAIDGQAVMVRLRKERDAFVSSTLKTISEIPFGICVRQRAPFIDDRTLQLDDGRRVSAKAFVVATGARPAVPKVFDGLKDLVLTNESVFELPTLPRSMAVVGAGPLGLELAQALTRLGVETHVFEQSDRLSAIPDTDVANAFISQLSAELSIHLGIGLEAARTGDLVQISWSGTSSGMKTFEAGTSTAQAAMRGVARRKNDWSPPCKSSRGIT